MRLGRLAFVEVSPETDIPDVRRDYGTPSRMAMILRVLEISREKGTSKLRFG